MDNEKITNTYWETIECGIGIIEYEIPSNLLLQTLMENLQLKIEKHGAKYVNELLETKIPNL